MSVKVKLEIIGLKGEVFSRHKHDDGTYAIEFAQEWKEPFKVKITTPRGSEELEVLPI